MSVSVIIVTYNTEKYLPDFLDSVLAQSYFEDPEHAAEVFVIDNASTDATVKIIRDSFPTVRLLRNVNNIGLARAWNQGLKLTSGEYVLIMNPDLVLDKDFLAAAVTTIESDLSIGSVGGKLYRLRLTTVSDDGLHSIEKTNILDSAGIAAFKNCRFIERGSGETDKGQLNTREEVFGISGACALFRRSALDKIKFVDEYFDEDFFMYQEDIDMAWRLRLAGYKNFYNPAAIAYHHRRAKSQSGRVGHLEVIRHRHSKDDFVNYHSYKNHLFLLYKNLFYPSFIMLLSIFWYELRKFIYVLMFENSTLRRSVVQLVKLRRKFRKKRRLNSQMMVVNAKELRQWFS